MRRVNLYTCMIWLMLPVLSGCPGGGGGTSQSPVSDAQRLASLDQVQGIVAKYNLNGDQSVIVQIAAELNTMPDFAVVKVMPGAVVARFTDDELLVVINNRPTGDAPEPPPSTTNKSIASQRAAGPSPLTNSIVRVTGATPDRTSIPQSKKALLINAMGNAYKDDTPEFEGWFAGAGYSPMRTDGSIESFRDDVKDIGVLYVSSHGSPMPPSVVPDVLKEVLEGVAETPAPTVGLSQEDPARDHYVIWTSTVITNATVEKYRPEVRRGRLAYLFAGNSRDANGNLVDARHFGITEAFVYDNWKCKPGALVYMDCCGSANAKIVDACVSDHVLADTYIGWTFPTWYQYSSSSARYFFDRSLGANSYSKTALPQRPHSVRSVQEAMAQRDRHGLDSDPFITKALNLNLKLDQSITTESVTKQLGIKTSDLIFYFRLQDCVLRPAIQTMATGQTGGQKTLVLSGAFGDDQGTVTADGTPLPVIDWRTNQITCSSTGSGAGSMGKIVVQAGEVVSNPRNLTQWNLTLHRLFMDFPTQAATDCPSCFYEATLHFTFRADVGPIRSVVDGDLTPKNATGAADEGDIEVTNAGGTYSIGQGSSITLAPNPDDGATLIGTCTGFSPPLDNNYLGACFLLQGDVNVIHFSPTIFAEGLLRNYHGGTFDGIVDPYQVVYSGNIFGNELNLSLSPNFTIEAGQQSTGPNSYFQWEAADALSPPDPNDPK